MELFRSIAGNGDGTSCAGGLPPDAGFDVQSTHINKPTVLTGHFSTIPRI